MQAEMLESPLDRTAQFLLSHPSLDAFSPYATRTIDMICPEKRKSSKKLEPLNLTSNPIANVLNHHYGEMINNRDQFSLPNEPFVGDELTCVSPLTSIMNGNPQADSVRANNMNSPRNASSRWTDMDNYEKLANRYEQQQSVTNSYEPQSNFSAGGPSLSTERMPETPVTLSRAISCPATVIERNLSPLLGITASTPPLSGDSLKKRKGYSNEVPSPPTNRKIECTRKTIKGEVLELNENMGNGKDAVKSSGNGDKEKPKSVPDIPKPDYIHVRARRGQATDSHSLAERVRREKISERMRLLQDLVPGCNKITGKAGMLDEIINYVQSLQRQVEFLSMKLAAVNRRSEGTAENGFSDKEMITPCNPSVPNVGLLPEISPSAFHHLNLMRLTAGSAMQQPQHAAAESCSMELPILINDHHSINSNSNRTINHNRKNNSIPTGMTLRRTISAPVAVTDDFIQSCFQDNGLPSMVTPAWDFDLPNLYTLDFPHATQSLLSSQTFSGNMETQNLKMDLMQ